MIKRLGPILALTLLAAFSPAPIEDRRPLVIQPEMSEAQRAQQQTGATVGEMGSTPERTENLAIPSISGDDNAASTVSGAEANASESSKKGAAAILVASRELPEKRGVNWNRIFSGGLILFAIFGLFAVFRMWANMALPDAPDAPNNN